MGTHDHVGELADARPVNDLKRDVYCVLGLPIDAIDMLSILRRIDAAAASRAPFLISTPNLNFLVTGRSDPEFRETILDSDLCPADGMPIVWLARLIGIPIKRRESGSDIFEALKAPDRCQRPLRVFLFGGAPGIARAAAEKLNAAPSGLNSVGWLDPGFGAVEEMSQDQTIDRINASQADFLVVSLGAKKGQLWLHRNHRRLKIPIRAHLGAVLNFQAGTINRAPPILRACGLEWLWRLKEEPHLWRRYAHDGSVLLRLLSTCILLLAILNRWYLFKSKRQSKELLIITEQNHDCVTIRLAGFANESNIASAITFFRETLIKQKASVVLDLTRTHAIDGRFFGLLLMLRKNLKNQGAKLQFVGISPTIRRLFWLNGLNFLLEGATE